MRRIIALAFAAGVLTTIGSAAGVSDDARSGVVAPRTRTVYVSALDANGAPVTDLTPADFGVKEGGKQREVTVVAAATAPMHIALLIDDNGSGIFRASVARFVQRLHGRAAFAISTVTGQTARLVDYTTSGEALVGALERLSARPGTPDGGQLLEGIFQSARELERGKADRSVIVALTVGGEEHSTLPAHHVLDQLRKSGAALHVISVAPSAVRSTVTVTKPSALLEENLNLNEVLGDGPKQSGGHHEQIIASAGIVLGMHQLAEALIHQYVIAYALPDGVKPSDRISVTVKRPGVSLRAPTRVPNH